MIVATGNINQPCKVIGVVPAVVTRTPKAAGCGGGGGPPVQEAYAAATVALEDAAEASGGKTKKHGAVASSG